MRPVFTGIPHGNELGNIFVTRKVLEEGSTGAGGRAHSLSSRDLSGQVAGGKEGNRNCEPIHLAVEVGNQGEHHEDDRHRKKTSATVMPSLCTLAVLEHRGRFRTKATSARACEPVRSTPPS